jgi:hypothetical protein
MDERERDWRDRDWRRSQDMGRGQEGRRWGEDRSWSADDPRGRYGDDERAEYETRERSTDLTTGGAYGRDPVGARGRYGGQPRFTTQDYTTGGPAYDVQRRATPRWRDDYDRQGYHGQDYGRRDDDRSYGAELGWDSDREDAWARYSPDRDYGRDYGRDDYRQARDRQARDHDAHDPQAHDHQDWRDGTSDFFSRAGERISSWFRGSDLMRGSREDDGRPRRYAEDFGREARPIPEPGHRGRGPRGYKRADDRISDEAHDRLTDDPWLDASNIEIKVKDGEITLDGAVDNREAKHRAERLVEDISGVGYVQNNLRVNPDLSLTGAGRGLGSNVYEAEMRREAGDAEALRSKTSRSTDL